MRAPQAGACIENLIVELTGRRAGGHSAHLDERVPLANSRGEAVTSYVLKCQTLAAAVSAAAASHARYTRARPESH